MSLGGGNALHVGCGSLCHVRWSCVYMLVSCWYRPCFDLMMPFDGWIGWLESCGSCFNVVRLSCFDLVD